MEHFPCASNSCTTKPISSWLTMVTEIVPRQKCTHRPYQDAPGHPEPFPLLFPQLPDSKHTDNSLRTGFSTLLCPRLFNCHRTSSLFKSLELTIQPLILLPIPSQEPHPVPFGSCCSPTSPSVAILVIAVLLRSYTSISSRILCIFHPCSYPAPPYPHWRLRAIEHRLEESELSALEDGEEDFRRGTERGRKRSGGMLGGGTL